MSENKIKKNIKVLFVGDLNTYGRGYQRMRSLQNICIKIDKISHSLISPEGVIKRPNFITRVFQKFRLERDLVGVNKQIINALKKTHYDLLWIEKGNMIYPWILKRIRLKYPALKVISISEDDMYARHGGSLWYKWGLKNYDIVFTTKSYNLHELIEYGAKNTHLFLDSYDELTHKKVRLNDIERKKFVCNVSAIGAFESERAHTLLYLAKSGIQVVVWGNGWKRWVGKHPNLIVKDQFLFGDDYSKAICGSRININFLRKVNRDEITSRSVEIPACGGFMLAERTDRHQEFFIEGQEADYFSSDQELLLKIDHYLKYPEEAEKIASAGYKKCLDAKYSMRDQIVQILNYCGFEYS